MNILDAINQFQRLALYQVTLASLDTGQSETVFVATSDPGADDVRGMLDLAEAWGETVGEGKVVTGITAMSERLILFPSALDDVQTLRRD